MLPQKQQFLVICFSCFCLPQMYQSSVYLGVTPRSNSGLISSSSFRNYSWWFLEYHMGCRRSRPGLIKPIYLQDSILPTEKLLKPSISFLRKCTCASTDPQERHGSEMTLEVKEIKMMVTVVSINTIFPDKLVSIFWLWSFVIQP